MTKTRGSTIAVLATATAMALAPTAHAQDTTDAAQDVPDRVLGGAPASLDEFPWQVALVSAGAPIYEGQFCGGSLIAGRWVLTAAHCVVSSGIRVSVNALVVYSGAADLRGNGVTTRVRQVFAHPGYDPYALANDVALLELEAPIAGTPVRLASPDTEPRLLASQELAVVTGWGLSDTRERPTTGFWGIDTADAGTGPQASAPSTGDDLYAPWNLMAAAIPIVDNATCAAGHGESGLDRGVVCAGAVDTGLDACRGDSGGPLQIRDRDGAYTQIGLVSWGELCEGGGNYGVYTRVASYHDWIVDTMSNRGSRVDNRDHRVSVGAPFYDTIALTTDFQPDPQSFEMEAGGENFAGAINPECAGFIAEVPDYDLEFRAGQYPLFISATSQADTTLVILTPSGQVVCSDDFDANQHHHPAISFDRPESGKYSIWVGTFDFDTGFAPAMLHISEIQEQF